jgi:hypothetical protein
MALPQDSAIPGSDIRDSGMPDISVIIPTWNRADLLQSALENLRQQTLSPAEIVVVDNGSVDETAKVAARFGSQHIALERNFGFAAAVNAGISAAGHEWILILNNDVELQPDWIERAIEAASQEGAQFIAGKILKAHAPERLDGTWDLVTRSGCAWRCGWNALDGPAWSVRLPIAIAPMTATLFHRTVFERVGLLDARYESYYEDVDFGLRCALAGLAGVYEPRAVSRHLGSATLSSGARMTYFVSRNQVLLAAKFQLTQLSRRAVWLGQASALLPSIRSGHLLAALKGKRDGIGMAKRLAAEQVDRTRLQAILERNENELRSFQEKLGFDLSWKLYFGLAGR